MVAGEYYYIFWILSSHTFAHKNLDRQIFNAILGWNNTATIGSIVSYCGYWLIVAAALVYMFFKERKRAIQKAERGEVDEDGDAALENAKRFIDQNEGVIVGTDVKESRDMEEVDVSHPDLASGEKKQEIKA